MHGQICQNNVNKKFDQYIIWLISVGKNYILDGVNIILFAFILDNIFFFFIHQNEINQPLCDIFPEEILVRSTYKFNCILISTFPVLYLVN